MDSDDISPTLLAAGQEYLASLRRLRLNPEWLFWARVNEVGEIADALTGEKREEDFPSGDWHLVLVTSAIDEGGPSAINQLLFKAWDAAATPKEISPFIVEVVSAKSPFVVAMVNLLNNDPSPQSLTRKELNKHGILQAFG